MSDYRGSSFVIKVPVHIPVSKEVFEAWENLDMYQEYLMEDLDIFIYEILSKAVTRKQMNEYIKDIIKHAQDSIEEANNEN
jgi:hypothetical protein